MPAKHQTTRELNDVTLVVQSTDSFSDCWSPFFTLLARYWPDCDYPILLNTETKTYQHPGLDIRCTRTQDVFGSRWPTWSETLLACLQMVDTEIILFMLDDFFISRPVEIEALQRCLEVMQGQRYSNITLSEHGHERPARETDHPLLLKVEQRARYRVTTSPALWRKPALRAYLRKNENAWEFEIFGSRRAWKKTDTFFIVDPRALKNGAEGVIPYFQSVHDSGIFKGKWQKEIRPFFRDEGIEVDYSNRGFYSPLPGFRLRLLLFKRLIGNPVKLFRGVIGW